MNTPLLPIITRPSHLWLCLMGVALMPFAARSVDQMYVNYGIVTTPPQIDALNFVNYGTFDFFTALPFETSDTINYTNYGRMIASPGWYFDTAPVEHGTRSLAQSFVNRNGGTIEA